MPTILWSLRYRRNDLPTLETEQSQNVENVLLLSQLPTDIAFEDNVLEDVKRAWQKITGESSERFMKFDPRSGEEEDDATL